MASKSKTTPFNEKRISDPVHGTIGLSKIECDIIDTPAFQRLRNVKQLGLAYYVFPGADYSRFAHSIGVCHVTGRILESLRGNGTDIDDREIQRYRLAGLCHDIGHYPFSHAAEEAIANHYDAMLLTQAGIPPTELSQEAHSDAEPYFNHEALGKEILKNDPDVSRLLGNQGFGEDIVSSVFFRSDPSARFANLVSSDLDADRIDYLLRTARHTGLPYGSVDIDYLLSQILVDGEQHVCIDEKALRAADHFLLCRYFDFQQVSYHKTVAAMEWVLKDVVASLLSRGALDFSGMDVISRITRGVWSSVDDAYMLGKIRELTADTQVEAGIRVKANSIIYRNPPKLLVQMERIDPRSNSSRNSFLSNVQLVRSRIPYWASNFRVAADQWHVWHKNITMTKIGSMLPTSTIEGGASGTDKDRYEQAVRVASRDRRTSTPISELPHSLMSVLSNQEFYALRVYVLLTPETETLRDRIERQIRSDLPNIGWNE